MLRGQTIKLVKQGDDFHFRTAQDNIDSILNVSSVSYGKEIKKDPKKFLEMILKKNELSVFEHTDIKIVVIGSRSSWENYPEIYELRDKEDLMSGSFAPLSFFRDDRLYPVTMSISGSLRDFVDFIKIILRDNGFCSKNSFICAVVQYFAQHYFPFWDVPESKFYEVRDINENNFLNVGNPGKLFDNRRIQFEIQTDRAIANQLVRHRRFSFVQRSTRRTDETGTPLIFSNSLLERMNSDISLREYLEVIEDTLKFNYRNLQDRYNFKKEEARDFLPLGNYTCLHMTGRIKDWKDFLYIRQRSKSKSQEKMVEIASGIEEELKKEGLLDENWFEEEEEHQEFYSCFVGLK